MKKKTYIQGLLLVLLAVPLHQARAETKTINLERTQYFWQPREGFSGLLALGEETQYQLSSVTNTGAFNYSKSVSTLQYSLTYMYGLSRDWAASLALSTSPSQTQTLNPDGSTTGTSTNGLNNLAVQFKNTTPLGKWNIHYGLALSFSLDINVPADVTESGNNFSGGDSVTPYLGASYNIFGRSFYGFRFQYAYLAPRNIDPDRVIVAAQQNTGGDISSLGLFFELHHFPWLLDFRGNLNWTDTTETTLLTSQRDSNSFLSTSEAIGIQYFFSHKLMARLDGATSQTPQITRTSSVQSPFNGFTGTVSLRDEF